MEFNIPDLLDGVPEATVELQPVDIASPARVRELTMRRIRTRKKRRFPGRRLTILVAAVVLVLGLAVTASADTLGIARWFGSFFKDVSPEQEHILESMAMEQPTEPVSDTVDGNTLTLVSAIGDGYNCYARLRFEASEGVDLTRDNADYFIYYSDYVLDESSLDLLSRPIGEAKGGYTYKFTWEDGTPNDNIVEAVLHISLDAESDIRFDDETPDTITIPGLGNGKELMMKGPWQLAITALGGESMGLEVWGTRAIHETKEMTTELMLIRLLVSQVGIEVAAEFAEPLTGEANFVYPTAYAVLTDGTVVSGSIPAYHYLNTLTSEECHYKLYFDAPVELQAIDHIRFCGEIFPVSGAGTVEPGEDPEEYTIGTHVVLGDPDSLKLSAEVKNSTVDFGNLTSRQWDSLSVDDKVAASGYAEYTEEGIRMYRWTNHYGDGRLAVTITGARAVRNMAELDWNYAGFDCEGYLKLAEEGWEEQELPAAIHADGTFEEKAILILVDMTVENQGVCAEESYWSPNQHSPYEFNTGLIFFANLQDNDSMNFSYVNPNYFTEEGGGWKNYVEVLPGQRKQVTVGYFFYPPRSWGEDWTMETLRACNSSGNMNSVFVDLNLE